MKVFFGAAIQGVKNRGERAAVYRRFLDAIKEAGLGVVTEHSAALDYPSTLDSLTTTYGTLPEDEQARRVFVRNKMIEGIEGDLSAAIFEVSTPSLGTGIELAHAYLRPRMGLPAIPILALYQIGYWPHHLSSMVRGIPADSIPQFRLEDYSDAEDGAEKIRRFLKDRARSR
jgi:hypothetical protein